MYLDIIKLGLGIETLPAVKIALKRTEFVYIMVIKLYVNSFEVAVHLNRKLLIFRGNSRRILSSSSVR